MEQCYSYPRFFSSLSEGSIDSSFGFESFSRCSSSDSSRSGGESLLFPLETSTSSPAHGVAYDSVSGNNDRLGMLHNTPGKYCVFDLGNSKIRNQSVTSPTPQQVSGKLAPFVHVGPSSTWDHQQHWQQQPVSRRSGESCNNQFDDSGSNGCFWTTTATALHEVRGDNNDYHQARPWRPSEEAHCGRGGLEPATATAKLGRHHQPRPRPRLSTSGGDPHCDLLKNGRDVAMDSVDMIQVRLRECGRLWRQTLDDEVSQPTKFGREPLKRRLAHIRALIREELEQASWRPPSESRPAGGPGPRRKRDRNAKRCKFCLSKKEDDDIVAHHNLFDARGLVACPILQQYECELCHATGRHAHTLKYCPQNNPDTPHDVILQARLKLFLRNRRGQ